MASEGFAAGAADTLSLDRAKAACVQLGVMCKAVTCADGTANSCTVRASVELTVSAGFTTHVPNAMCTGLIPRQEDGGRDG